MLLKSNTSSGVFSAFFKYIFYIKIWHAASNNGINLFKIIVINNRNYNLKEIIDNYDFCHNRAALVQILILSTEKRRILGERTHPLGSERT